MFILVFLNLCGSWFRKKKVSKAPKTEKFLKPGFHAIVNIAVSPFLGIPSPLNSRTEIQQSQPTHDLFATRRIYWDSTIAKPTQDLYATRRVYGDSTISKPTQDLNATRRVYYNSKRTRIFASLKIFLKSVRRLRTPYVSKNRTWKYITQYGNIGVKASPKNTWNSESVHPDATFRRKFFKSL